MSNFEQPAYKQDPTLRRLEGIIFDLLLTSDGRTTDLLETLMDEKMQVSVLKQESFKESIDAANEGNGEPYAATNVPRDIVRESILVGTRSRTVVSHNMALIHGKLVPPALLERIALGHEGIGKAISSIGAESFRKIADYGKIASKDALDLHGKPIKLQCAEPCEDVFYKKYVIYFGLLPGIQLLEYFNPNIVKHRLEL